MKTFIKKSVIIMLIICILLPSLFGNMALAVNDNIVYLTTERAGNYMANFAILYYENWESKTYYGTSSSNAYEGKPSAADEYEMSAYGFINFVIHQSLGLGEPTYTSMITQLTCSDDFVEVTIQEEAEETNKLLQDDGTINITEAMSQSFTLPGDILISKSGNVFLYVGAGQVIYCTSNENDKAENGIKYEYMNQYLTRRKTEIEESLQDNEEFDMSELTPYQIVKIVRVKGDEEGFTQIPEDNANLIFAGKGYNDTNNSYYGIPQYGSYTGSESLFSWLIDLFKDILNYLLGIMTLGMKIQLIGWTQIVSDLMNDVVLKVSGQDTNAATIDEINGPSATTTRAARVTVENIILNKIGILDVNFFNTKQAGGVEISENSIIYSLKIIVAQWYYIIRVTSIIVMLIILIYTGLKLALTASSEKKALYKKMLIDWVVGFLIIFIIHYFMEIVIFLNEQIIGMLAAVMEGVSDGSQSLYETIRTKAYSLKFTEGFAGTIMFMYLVYITVRFLFIYLKRYLTVNILALMGPIMGIRYALDKVGGKKTSKSLISWMFDFSMNVFIQIVHALIYVSFMSVAYEMAATSLLGFVCALVIMNFMLKADKITMKIFHFNQSASIGDTNEPESLLHKMTEAYGIAKGAAMLGKGILGFGKGVAGRTVDFGFKKLDGINEKNNREKFENFGFKARGTVARFFNRRINSLPIKKLKNYKMLRSMLGETEDYELNKGLSEAIKLKKQLRNKTFTRTIGEVAGGVIGAGKFMVGIPMAIAEPGAGLSMMIAGYKTVQGKFENTNKQTQRHKNRILMKQASYKKLENEYLDNRLKLQQSNQELDDAGIQHSTDTSENLQRKIISNETSLTMLYDAGDMSSYYIIEKQQEELKKQLENLLLEEKCEQQGEELNDKYTKYKLLVGNAGYSNKYVDDMNDIAKKAEKVCKKLETIEEAQDIEQEIKDLYKDIKVLETRDAVSKGIPPSDINKNIENQMNEIVNEGIKKSITNATITQAIADYMYENNVGKIQIGDINGVMDKIKDILKTGGSKITISADAYTNIETELKKQIAKKKRNGNLLPDDAVSAIEDGLAKKNSIDSPKAKAISNNSSIKDKYDEIQEKVRQLKVLNDKSRKKYGGQVCNIKKFVSEMQE